MQLLSAALEKSLQVKSTKNDTSTNLKGSRALNKHEYDNITEMDWGAVTPEFFNQSTNTVVHVFNHYIADNESLERAVKFAIGRIFWMDSYLMNKFNHIVTFDDCGQNIDLHSKNRIRAALSDHCADVVFSSER